MKPIILLIIIFFIWRHFKKKKANKAERQASSQSTAKSASASSAAASKSAPASVQKNAAPSASSAELHFDGFPIYTPEIRKLGPCRGTPVSESNLPKNNFDLYTCKGGNDNPDYDFACARKFFNKYTEKWKEQQERSRENLQNGEDCVTLTTMHGAKGLEFRIVFFRQLLKDF